MRALAALTLATAAAALNWWAFDLDIDVSPLAPGGAAPIPGDAPRVEPAPQTPQDTAELYSETLSRPLFRSNRRPAEVRTPDDGEQAALEHGDGQGLQGVELAGVMREGGKASRALVRSPASPMGSWVEVGHLVDGWRLSEIDDSGIVFEAGGQRRKLSLFPSRTQ